jgi:hypothetical protein
VASLSDCGFHSRRPAGCDIPLVALSSSAEGPDASLEGASVDRPNSRLFIGPPPAEIELLVADTREAAQDLKARGHSFGDCSGKCVRKFTAACVAGERAGKRNSHEALPSDTQ